mmetsp:Transcript_26354/g.46825  ORF Transcript_26354/g.46825 Transcript_26354/m.46825 type:complete len:347 (+) Transcript_26354:315-1355(+)
MDSSASNVQDFPSEVSIRSSRKEHASSTSLSSNDEQDQSISKGGVTTPFPWKLHIMLDHMEDNGDKSIVCWQPHGRAFTVHKPKEFVVKIMPKFFNQTKYASFQRQLNLYGFSRLTHGPDKGAYYHSCFVRGERNLCRRMIRQKIKGTKVRKTLSPEEEPNFYRASGKLPVVPSQESIPESSGRLPLNPVEVTPVVAKPVKRVKQHLLAPSTATMTSKPVRRPGAVPNEMMAFPPIQPFPPTRTVSPHQSVGTLQELGQHYQQQQDFVVETSQDAKGGDLLFFEGQPFRYLEHLDALPPLPSSMKRLQRGDAQYPTPRTSLQDMITTIANLDIPRDSEQPHNVSSN